jgi:hypothetical protein
MMSSRATGPAAPLLIGRTESRSSSDTEVGTIAIPQPMSLPTA